MSGPLTAVRFCEPRSAARAVNSSVQLQARQFSTQLDLIAVRNDRLANRIALHLALGGGFPP
jgi:hypothetical protein